MPKSVKSKSKIPVKPKRKQYSVWYQTMRRTNARNDLGVVHVGIYPLCHLNVELIVLPDEDGGHVSTRPNNVCLPRVIVGLKYDDWEDVVAVFLHETYEFCMMFNQARFQPTDKPVEDYGGFVFHFDHAQFTKICEHAAQFVTAALPDLASAYSKHRKKKQ